MKMTFYAIKDNVAGRFLVPQLFDNELVMRRAISSAVNEPSGTLLYKYPGDCAVYKVAEFDDETGKVTSIEPEFLFNAIEFKEVIKDA